MKKYKFTKETINHFGTILRRIVATRDFGSVKKGDLGGFIQGESNLSHDSGCWVYDNAKVYNSAHLCDWARAKDSAWIFENARMSGCSNARDEARISGDAWVLGDVEKNGCVSGCQEVLEHTTISSTATLQRESDLPDPDLDPNESTIALRKTNKNFGKETYRVNIVLN